MTKPERTRVVAITGASSGIGLCSAALFAARGWRVGLISRSDARLVNAVALIASLTPGARLTHAAADVIDSEALSSAARSITAALGPIDVWVNAAGNGVYGRFTDVSEREFRRVTDVTYLGTVNGTRVALAHMQPRNEGSIVNVCSAVVFHGVPLMSSYSGAKAAVRAFGQSLRLELRLAGSRVRVGTLFPPAINTPFFDHAASHMGFPARPVPPVYAPEVAAEGVYACATGRGGEMILTGVVIAYALITRLSLRLAGYLVSKSDFASELPQDDAGSLPDRASAPALFQPQDSRCRMQGGFASRARGWSTHLRLLSIWRRLPTTRPLAGEPVARPPAATDLRPARPGAQSPATRAGADRDHPQAGSAQPRRTASDSIR
ncbi:SDR family oxidoreductase [Lichenicola sp.]|uniref:SDR family oxidoreductase n=1 Tax=Lichenicola sp. TaxID=2804529 RepID=UPI003AFFA56F